MSVRAAEPSAGDAAVAAQDVRFSRHVIPLFSRLGCNAGVCHGAVKGQNGFRLSLFGAEPGVDHQRLLREGGGRRLDPFEADRSLLLLKATGQVTHGGGKRIEQGSPAYRLIQSWIAAGAPLDALEQSRLSRLTIAPAQNSIRRGESYGLRVEATFADGSREDVTSLCSFEVVNKELAQVDELGRVRALGIGDTAVIARYRAEPVIAMLLVPRQADEPFPEVTPVNFIDRHILAKLRLLNIHPAEGCDDATFLRRASLDVTGLPPTPAEVRAFLADNRLDKRQQKIEELLSRPGYSAMWATKFCDLLRPSGFDGRWGFLEAAESRRFYQWLRDRVNENTPYDELAERILLAASQESRAESAEGVQQWVQEVRALIAENEAKTADLKAYSGRKTLDLYWQRAGASGVKGALQVAHAFLGLRLECAQCHRHPHDVWQQDDLLSFANFFMRVGGAGGGGSSAPVVKEADRLSAETKGLKDRAKEIGEKAKDKSLTKEDVAKLQAEAKSLTEKAAALEALGRRLKATEIHRTAKATFASVTSTLGQQESKQFRLLGEAQAQSVAAEQDPREAVMTWLRRADNPFFARAIVNRVWAHYFGRGIIEPADQLSPLNPASHPELLTELCADFIRSGYDLKHLHRTILQSRTYQQSAKTNATSRTDTVNYASAYLRRLPAEVLVDVLNHAAASSETFPPELYLPAGSRALEVAGGTGNDRARASLHYAFQIFGRPMRNPDVQCDCERDTKPTMVQTLYLANHPVVRKKIDAPDGRIAQLLRDLPDDEQRIEDLFLWTLSREPTAEERQTCRQYVKESASSKRGLEDVFWSLLNTREFLLNY
jgi:hypothetical protein